MTTKKKIALFEIFSAAAVVLRATRSLRIVNGKRQCDYCDKFFKLKGYGNHVASHLRGKNKK